MSTLRVSNIEAKADASSPTIDEKVKITSSDGRVLVQVDGKTAGITSIGINTTSTSFTIDGNQNVQFVGVITAANVNTTGVSTFTRLNVGTGGTVITTTAGGLVGIGTTNPLGILFIKAGTNRNFNFDTGGGSGAADLRISALNDAANANVDLQIQAANTLFNSNGSERVRITSNGLVGIGITNPAVTLSVAGTVNYTGTLQQNGSNVIQWVEITPAILEFSWTGSVTSSAKTLPSAVSTSARYVLADVFVTASTTDHQSIVLGRDVLTDQKNWVDTRGTQPSTQFGTLTRQAVTLSYFGESDGFSSNYGIWYSSQHIPTTGRTFYFNNYGNSGSNGWVYIVVKAYSL